MNRLKLIASFLTLGVAVSTILVNGGVVDPATLLAYLNNPATPFATTFTLINGNAGATNTVGGTAAIAGGLGNGAYAGGPLQLTGGVSGSGATGAGGAVTIAGGASAATNDVGGAATTTGGAGAGTGAGGAASVTGGAGGGGATGNGGAASLIGGAATSTAGVGGAVTITGGLGTTTGAGGAVTITSGAAGSTGVAGAVNIAVGAATAGAGSAVTITGGNGAGGTAAGGNVNLVPGTAVSTGAPGEIQVNSAAGLFEAAWVQGPTANVPVSGTNYSFFLAGRAYRVKSVKLVCASTGTVGTVDITKDTGTTAAGGGTSCLTAPSAFNTTSQTVVTPALATSVATLTLAAGDRLAFKMGGTVGSLIGAVISVTLVPV